MSLWLCCPPHDRVSPMVTPVTRPCAPSHNKRVIRTGTLNCSFESQFSRWDVCRHADEKSTRYRWMMPSVSSTSVRLKFTYTLLPRWVWRPSWRAVVALCNNPRLRKQLLHDLLAFFTLARASVMKSYSTSKHCLLATRSDVITVINVLVVHFCLYIHVFEPIW